MAEVVYMPKLGLGMTYGIITKLLVNEGQQVRKDEPIIDFETNKLTDTLTAPIDGTVLKIFVTTDEEVPIRKPVLVIGNPGDSYELEEETANVPAAQAPAAVPEATVKAASVTRSAVNVSPIAKKIAEERGIDLSLVVGTGPKGRIMKEDVLAYKPKAPSACAEDSVVDMSPTRKSIAASMSRSKHDVPHVYLEITADVTKLELARKRYMEDGPGKVSYNDIILYASVLALKENMELNSSVDGNKIIRHGVINLGVPTNNERGLLVPVIKGAEAMNLWDIHLKAAELVEKTKASKLTMDEMTGGTFTVSNLGGFGIRSFHAIINTPEAMILAVGEIYAQLEMAEDGIRNAKKINLSLSLDHRIADGIAGAKYLKSLKTLLEDPAKLFAD